MNTLSVSLFVVRFTPCVLLDESTVDSVVTVICLKDDSLVASGSPELVGAGNPVVELVHLGVLVELEPPELVARGPVSVESEDEVPVKTDVPKLPDPRIVVARMLLDCSLWLTVAVEFGGTLIVDVNFLVNVLVEVAFMVSVELIL